MEGYLKFQLIIMMLTDHFVRSFTHKWFIEGEVTVIFVLVNDGNQYNHK